LIVQAAPEDKPLPRAKPEHPPGTPAPDEAEELGELKELLVDADGVSRVLSQAVSISTSKGDQLARALRPTIEASLEESTRRNPGMLADAIFPVLGPAIRKSINETFDSLVQSLQTTLEHSMSAQGWKWRFEAWRTGKSFAEVVLSHTLIYQVEALFLIHKESSVLLKHVVSKEGVVKDEDMVSGMLSAIQDFVGDSFDSNSQDKLQTMQVGELSVWIEESPNLTLAAVIRGKAPVELRQMLREALEEIEAGYSKALRQFNGDVAIFEGTEPVLERCLRTEKEEEQRQQGGAPIQAYVALGVMALVIGWFVFTRWSAARQWEGLIAAINQTDGYFVKHADRAKRTVHLLRDPYADALPGIVREHGYDEGEIRFLFEDFVSLSDSLLARRAVARLKPPPGIHLSVHQGRLTASGQPNDQWDRLARQLAPQIPGIRDFQRVSVGEKTPYERAIETVNATVIEFGGGVTPLPGQEAKLRALIDAVKTIIDRHPDPASIPVIRISGDTRLKTFVAQSFTRAAKASEFMWRLLREAGVDAAYLYYDREAAGEVSPGTADGSQDLVVTFQVTRASR